MLDAPSYDDQYVAALFDRMGPTYDLVNRISSFGFCELWRYQCIRNAEIKPGAVVCDFMAGSGECWPYLKRQNPSKIIAVDFSTVMVQRQEKRRMRSGLRVEIIRENATSTSIGSHSVDHVVAAFGLKTLSPESLAGFARELRRILKPGGTYSLLEISRAEGWLLGAVYRFYLSYFIPLIGRSLLGDIECYRMLGVYTEAFGSCAAVAPVFREAGLTTEVHRHFFGCASALVGKNPG